MIDNLSPIRGIVTACTLSLVLWVGIVALLWWLL